VRAAGFRITQSTDHTTYLPLWATIAVSHIAAQQQNNQLTISLRNYFHEALTQ